MECRVANPLCTHALPVNYPSKTLICSSPAVVPVEVKSQLTEAQLYKLFSELPGKTLTCRLANCISGQTLQLEVSGYHARCFNEVVRRIDINQQLQIMDILSAVTDDQINTIVQCCYDPSLLTRNNYELLKSSDFPYQLLRAFRDEKITVNEFATMLSLHGIYQENHQLNAGFELQLKRLFDQNCQPIEASWKAIAETLYKSNEDSLSTFCFNIDHIIKTMQEKLATVRPIEAVFWHYPIPKSSGWTVADAARWMDAWALSRFADQEMVPGISTRQALLDAAFNEEAHRINPVIGASSVADIRNGGEGRYRDFALPFPGIPLPKKADHLDAPFIIDFQVHDYYHLLRMSLLANRDVDLYLAIGDELQRQRDRYDHAIDGLKLICEKKLAAYEEFEKRIGKLPVEQRQKAMARLGRDFYQVSRLMTYLKKARKATGQFKFKVYDMEMMYANCRQDADFGEGRNFTFHYKNLINLFHMFSGVEGQEFLDGMLAEITGRIVIPMISGGLKSPEETFRTLEDKYTVQLERLRWPQRKQQRMSVRELKRSIRFIAALNRVNDDVDMKPA